MNSVEAAWKKFKSGATWAEYKPICRDETIDTHSRHMIFNQGWYAALEQPDCWREHHEGSGCSSDPETRYR